MSEPHLRASDQEREQAAAEIREHYAAGRLDEAEFEERLQAAYAARTHGELATIRHDLPALPVTGRQARAALRARRADLRRRALQEAGGSLSAFGICVVVWAATGATSFFWPVFVLLGPLAVVVRTLWALYGPAPDLDAVEARLSHRRRREERERRRERRRG